MHTGLLLPWDQVPAEAASYCFDGYRRFSREGASPRKSACILRPRTMLLCRQAVTLGLQGPFPSFALACNGEDKQSIEVSGVTSPLCHKNYGEW